MNAILVDWIGLRIGQIYSKSPPPTTYIDTIATQLPNIAIRPKEDGELKILGLHTNCTHGNVVDLE